MHEPHLRAADADRAAVATVLGQHMSAGRLTVEEYDERLARAYAAKTYGELDELTADLPPTDSVLTDSLRTDVAARPERRPDATVPGHIAPHGGWQHDPQSWRSWLVTSAIVLTIWAATSLASWEFLYFWPIWVIGPWGAFLLVDKLRSGDADGDRRRLD
jgi:hypothetical protein